MYVYYGGYSEQIQLIGIYKDAAQLKSDLLMYKSWFKK